MSWIPQTLFSKFDSPQNIYFGILEMLEKKIVPKKTSQTMQLFKEGRILPSVIQLFIVCLGSFFATKIVANYYSYQTSELLQQ